VSSFGAQRHEVRRLLRAPAPGAAVLVAFSAAAVGAGLGRALLTTYLPVLLERIHDAPGLIGTVMLVNTAAGFFVPLVVGVWSDQLRDAGHGRTVPFVLGGSLVAAGGLAAVALGYASSYITLALFAAIGYVGLNAVTTGHRALIPENFDADERAAATGGEELAMLLGTLAGVLIGGILIDAHGWAPFAAGAVLLPVLALPTVSRMRGRERTREPKPHERRGLGYYARAARRPGARLVLAAQALWVLGYVGLAPFFILYAKRELDLPASTAAALLAGFGLATGAAMLAAGTAKAERHRALLIAGAMAMGAGLLTVSASSGLALVAAGLLPVAIGFGVLTTLGFPAYSAFIPGGEEGAYSALYFAVRAVSSAIAVPAAGWMIELTGSYRAMFAFGGCVTLAALLPLGALSLTRRPALRPILVPLGLLVAVTAVVLAAGLAVDRTALLEADKELFSMLNGIGSTPVLVDRLIVDPHIQNYVLLTLLAGLAARRWRPGRALRTAATVAASGLVAYAMVRLCWALWDRPRPQELLGIVPANEHDWGDYPSFPSGHVAVTTAIVVAGARLLPALRVPLYAYAGLIAVTRVTYGAHFLTDVLAGLALGYAAGHVTAVLGAGGASRLPDALRAMLAFDSRSLRRLARASGATALGTFLLLAVTAGLPASPDGGVLGDAPEHELQIVLLALAAVALACGWYRDPLGGALVPIGVALGVFAALQYTPLTAVFACLAFALPGTLFLLAWDRVHTLRGAGIVAAAVSLTLAFGAVAALEVHSRAFGPAHPESSLAAPPTWRVRWAWSGNLTSDSVTVNARLNSDATARLLVARRRDLAGAVASAPQTADEERNDRILSFTARGLAPQTEYVYALEVDGRADRNRFGRFRTPAAGPQSFKIAFSACARTGSDGSVYDMIRREDAQMFLVLGDFFYSNIEENAPGRFIDAYDRALTSPAQGALYRRTPVAYVWDDHDFGGNGSGASSEARPAARSVYGAAMPHYPLGGREGPINQAFTIGRVRFIMLDGRYERTDESMLGERQTRWLERELLAARDKWPLTVLVSPVPWIERAEPGSDGWGGFAAERARLSRFIARNRIRNLLMLAGDAHMLAIDDGSHSDYSGTGRAGFPLMHAGALDRPGHAKGGPYSEGAFPGSGQYGTMTVDDRGSRLDVRLRGRDYRGREIVSYSFSVASPR
jgi:MFS family permease/membrane-associated phospholipid phosphatase